MAAQLSAIAREFSLPSTLGLATYVQLPTTPPITARASDDSWPILWSHHLSITSPPTPFPVAGSLEFEIDILKAKWFHAWLNGALPVDVAGGWNALSGTSVSGSVTQVPAQRRLSLLDRRAPSHNPSRLFESTATSASESSVSVSLPVETRPMLSAIPQLDSPPQTAHKLHSELNAAVQAWRATSVVGSPLPGTTLAHPSPTPSSPTSSLDLNDYDYAISSAGPVSPIPSPFVLPPSQAQRRRARSVHLQDIMAGSVPCTPSTRTSWGPGSPYPNWSALVTPLPVRTPDVGEREMDEAVERVWPVVRSNMGWPYLDKKEWVDVEMRSLPVTLSAVYPTFELYPPGYPHLEIYPALSFAPEPKFKATSLSVTLPRPIACYPSFNLYPAPVAYPNMEIYPSVVPAFTLKSKPISLLTSLPRPTGCYPSFDLYPAPIAYPNMEIYPSVVPAFTLKSKPISLPTSLPRPAGCYPSFDLYTTPIAYPNLEIYPAVSLPETSKSKSLPVTLPTPPVLYPDFNLYPAPYPNLVIYPAVHLHKEVRRVPIEVALPRVGGYPRFDLYPAGYPVLDICE